MTALIYVKITLMYLSHLIIFSSDFVPLHDLWSYLYAVPGVLLTGAASAVQRDHFLPTDAGLTHRTHLSVRPGLQPLQTHGQETHTTLASHDHPH